jgi:hypothetical protein
MEKRLALPISIFSLCLLNGCGTNSLPPRAITVTISPSTAVALDVNQSLPISANANNDSGNRGFDWALTCGGGNCGTITTETASGAPATFTAPGAPPSVPVTITATLGGGASLPDTLALSGTGMITGTPSGRALPLISKFM